MLVITATWLAQPGREAALKKQLETMVHAVRASEPDCLEYTLLQGTTDKALFVFYERYKDQAAFDFHRTTVHYQNLGKMTAGLTAQPVRVQQLGLLV